MTDVPLKEYLETRVLAAEGRIQARLDAGDRAIALHAETLTDRLLHANGLLERLREQAGEFARKEALQELERRVGALEQAGSGYLGRDKGREPMTAVVLIVVAAVVGAIVTWVASRGLT